MSSPGQQRMRQPGRLLTPYDPGNCQVCDPNFGIPGNSIGLIVTGTGYPCCSIDLDSPPDNFTLTSLADPCLKDAFGNPVACTWQYTIAEAGLYIRYSVTLECAGGSPQVNFSIDEVDASGNFVAAVASGQYLPTGACGAVDCSALDGAGGHLTLYGGNVCNPGFPGCANNASWSVLLGTGVCPENRANECCCGGQPPPPCFHICINDSRCPPPTDIRVCQTRPNHYEGSSEQGPIATLDYSTSTGWTITWQCLGPSGTINGSVTIAPGDPGWTIVNGQMSLSASGDGWTITAGPRAQCIPACTCCAPWNADAEIEWDLTGVSFPKLTTNPNDPCNANGDAQAFWVVGQTPAQGCCAEWYYNFLIGPYGPNDPTCGYLLSNITIDVKLFQAGLGGQCQFVAKIAFCCVSQGGLTHQPLCGTPGCGDYVYTAIYNSAWLDPGTLPCDGWLDLTFYGYSYGLLTDPGPPSGSARLQVVSA